MITIQYQGGPRDGKTEQREKNPRMIGCKTDAHRVGMHGVYKYIGKHPNGNYVMKWKEIAVEVTAQVGGGNQIAGTYGTYRKFPTSRE